MIKQIVKNMSLDNVESKEDVIEKLIYFREASRKGLDLLSDSEINELTKEFNEFININLAFGGASYPTKLFRITNNKFIAGKSQYKLQKITDLLGPPEGKSKTGRCNLPGESVFYASLDVATAVWETQPQVGDHITMSEWKIKEGLKFLMNF
jgi:hypothetical protein